MSCEIIVSMHVAKSTPAPAPGSKTLTFWGPVANMDDINWAIATGVRNCPSSERAALLVAPLKDLRTWSSVCDGSIIVFWGKVIVDKIVIVSSCYT